MQSRSVTAALLAAALWATLAPPAHGQPDTRITVKTADDLPRHTYMIEGKALDLLKDDARFNALLATVVADVKADLTKYKIEDATTLRGIYDFLQTTEALKGNLDAALEWTAKAKALETKESEKVMRGLSLAARAAAEKAAGGDKVKFADVFKRELRQRLNTVPYELVKDRLIGLRAQAKMVTRELIEASIGNQFDPIIEANKGQVPQEVVAGLVTTRFTLDVGLPLLPLIAEVYGDVIDAHANAAGEADLWSPRLVTLDASAKAKPVAIGIWDSGVDTALYPDQLWTNAGEKADGQDNDGNGFVDDLHGIAFGLDHKPTTGPLASLAGLKGNKDQLIGFIAASQDMQAGIENPGVDAFRNYYKSLDGPALKQFSDDLSLLGGYCHGTHVAGVAVAGNPFARLVHVTENWPWKAIPDAPPTVAEYKQWGVATRQAVDYFHKAGVRVVNMSWRIGRSAVEGQLEATGTGKNAEERAELSRKIFAELRNGLEAAIKSAPDILFIAGSGNEDNDVDFNEYVPAGLRLPNLITVGAIDDHDRPTTFTTTGKNVELYANGYRIESFIPGGQKVKFSGTSMAAPQVTNLAAKLWAVNPELKPAEVVSLIRSNADPLPGQPGRLIINPKKTVGAVQNSK